MTIDEFEEALGADVVIENVARPGCLSVTEMWELRAWWNRRQEQLRQTDTDPEGTDERHR